MNKDVDEIKIQRQSAGNGFFRGCFAVFVISIHGFDVLDVISRQSGKYQDAYERDGIGHSAAFQEESIYQRGNDYADQAHEQKASHSAQVAFGCVAVKAHGAKSCSRNQENAGDAFSGIQQQNRAKRYAHQCGIKPKYPFNLGGSAAVDDPAKGKDDNQRCQKSKPSESGKAGALRRDVIKNAQNRGIADHQPRDQSRNAEAAGHIIEYLHQVLAQTFIDNCRFDRGSVNFVFH